MFVKKLILNNYRNYDELVFEPEKETNLIYGKNGQGKTNIVEAITFFASLRSHRVSKHRDLIKYEKDFANLTLFFENNDREYDFYLRVHESISRSFLFFLVMLPMPYCDRKKRKKNWNVCEMTV